MNLEEYYKISRLYVGDRKVSMLGVRLSVGTFYTKQSHKIHYSQQSIKIRRVLNTSRQFLSYAKSQLNTTGFHWTH
ncbi:hypothetical protein MTR_8g009295 [Medicago truncatula]|uniref:Uncharacterized protein n=1 Tax=Medicago truncatula TaxID=3880 RepID=A0A072TKM6_MEDTR|nr:hypothetical protein MTR_8g009295 [Medicago truncatula]